MRPRLDKRHVAVVVGMDGKRLSPESVHAVIAAGYSACWQKVLKFVLWTHLGYHYTRAQLDQFPDPDEAHARRGAYWTFDGTAFVSKMQELHVKGVPALRPRPCSLAFTVQENIKRMSRAVLMSPDQHHCVSS